jgi:amidohydrolase
VALIPDDFLKTLRSLRRELHRYPELSHKEFETQKRLERAICELGLKPKKVAKTGLIADLVGDPHGPLICVRGDIDALPLTENTGLEYASKIDGVMHACGHDVHAAAAWGAMALLGADPPPGIVRVLFQPGEERANGAIACVKEGALEGVDAVVTGHVDLTYTVGTVGLQVGPICASTDHFRITVHGKTCHAARPQQGVDALLAAAHVVIALQQIVAREIEPGEPAVVTVGELKAGDRYNILAGKAVMEGTTRAQSPHVRTHLMKAIQRVATHTATGCGARADVELFPASGPVVNDPKLSSVVGRALRQLLGSEATIPLKRLNMGGDDFSDLTRDCPGVYLRWGAASEGKHHAPAHSPEFQVDEDVLAVATAGLETATRALIDHLK